MDKIDLSQKILFFSDIDDTLIQTYRKTDFKREAILWGVTKDEEPISYIYKGTKKWLDVMVQSRDISFIPTTARNLDSYKRTNFYRDSRYSSKIDIIILNFGSEILIKGKIEKKWKKIIKKRYNSLSKPIDKVYKKSIKLIKNRYEESHGIVIKIIDNYYISIYNKKYREDYQKNIELELILKEFISDEYYLHRNDSSFAILPKFLNKQYAVDYIIKKYNPLLVLGAGDNISDLDFMRLGDFAIMPQKSQVMKFKSS